MKEAQRNLLIRVATAVVGLPVVGAFLYATNTRWLLLLAGLACVAALLEYTNLTLKGRPALERGGITVLGTCLFLTLYLRPDLALAWSMCALLGLGVLMVPRATEFPAAAHRLLAGGFGIFYVGGLLSALPLLHRVGREWVVLAIALTFANDTGAYFVGRAIGKHKLAPAISPGKTWEGAVGGLAASIGVALGMRATLLPELSLLDTLLLGAPAAVLGPTGDLLESLLKRSVGAKDSGRLLPGHGGMLDRIDALLFVGAYVYLYATLLR